MAQRAFARLQTLQNQLAPFDASVLEGYLEPQSLLIGAFRGRSESRITSVVRHTRGVLVQCSDQSHRKALCEVPPNIALWCDLIVALVCFCILVAWMF